MATLEFLGAVGEVTGSRYRIRLDDEAGEILLECGLHQGGPGADKANRESLAGLAKGLSAVVLSHGHLDHAGLLPKLVRDGYRGPIHCTRGTQALLEIMLSDAATVMDRDTAWQNRRRGNKADRVEPVYDMDDVVRTLQQCVGHGYGKPVELPGGVRLVFRDAGHILGSASVDLAIPSGGRDCRLVFSGDLGNPDSVLMREPETLRDADVVLMESTYGDRDHRPADETLKEFQQVLEDAQEAGGNVLIPAFAVGRTQEILYHLSRLYHAGKLPQQRIFLDSPMAIRVTELYAEWRDLLDEDDLKILHELADGDPARYLPGLRRTKTVEESQAISRVKGGAIIIAGAGMCSGGRILHHLHEQLGKRATRVVIVGFQAEGTLGRQLVDGAESVRILGDTIDVRASIHTIGGFSAHAGQSQLLAWVGAFRDRPRVYLVHGEPGAQAALQAKLAASEIDARIPEPGESIML
ncbi:MBL fold metallo-hydrolase [Methylonatrum kenyense]|uniref:MBL fold metallo-hydrolase RNA specificity domain-containing protein n=1 Tax=Methylonatrum kenyense TaxID=455253 RepID=UPI0020BF261F|nr:MBL fold metallo-hydrolase [Methylonatrum kenyense]MCK8515018.1 MBL fold metallo-hydrolase [Methylonatrum kenyense]